MRLAWGSKVGIKAILTVLERDFSHSDRGDEMPVKHNLYEDLQLSKEQVAERQKSDPHLAKLLTDYDALDGQVLEAEANAAADDELKKLKEKRLLIKDKIVQQLEYPGSRGAAKNF